MTIRLYADETGCAIFDVAPGGSDPADPADLSNRPFADPMNWLSSIYFHSDFNYYGVAASNMAKVISHATVTGRSKAIGDDIYATTALYGRITVTTHSLLTHGLPYVPRFFTGYDGKMIPHGTPIQAEAGGQRRFVSAYATSTEIRLRDIGVSTNSDLPSASRTYQILAFRSSVLDPLLDMLLIEPANVVFGQGKFRSAEPHLRESGAGDTIFAQALGVAAGIRNGGIRVYPPNGSAIDYGGYNGSLTAPAFVNLAIGV